MRGALSGHRCGWHSRSIAVGRREGPAAATCLAPILEEELCAVTGGTHHGCHGCVGSRSLLLLNPSRQMLPLLLHRVYSRLAALISATIGQHSCCFVSVAIVKLRLGVLPGYVCLFFSSLDHHRTQRVSPSFKDLPA